MTVVAPISGLGPLGLSLPPEAIGAHPPDYYPAFGLLIEQFDLWRQGYAGSVVTIFQAGGTVLSDVFTDPQLTVPAANPQTLLTYTDSRGATYGKFAQSLYTPVAYYLDIDGGGQTGIERAPILELAGEDASGALVTRTDGTQARRLEDRAADVVHALDFGPISTSTLSSAANTLTIQTAIGAASAQGGGTVLLPPGVIPFNQLTLPTNVTVAGQGEAATTLSSMATGTVVRGTGDGCGLRDLTLDGLSLVGDSVGVGGTNLAQVSLTRVTVKRFATGVQFRGGSDHEYQDLTVTNCTVNASLLGDSAASSGGGGGAFTRLHWRGGELSLSTDTALDLSVIDQPVDHCTIDDVRVITNSGEDGAVLIGTRFCLLRGCQFDSNVCHIRVADNTDTSLDDRQTSVLRFEGGSVTGSNGVMKFDGLCDQTVFFAVEISDCDIQLNLPSSPILAEDCVETNTTLNTGGDTTKWERYSRTQKGTVFGLTTSATLTTAWRRIMGYGETVLIEVKATADQLNGVEYAAFQTTQAARGAPVKLNFIDMAAAFTAGNSFSGLTSGASGIALSETHSGVVGNITAARVDGIFVPGEVLKEDSGSGQARLNGSPVPGNASLVGSAASIYAGRSSSAMNGVGIAFAVTGEEVQVQLQGTASVSLDWAINISLTGLDG